MSDRDETSATKFIYRGFSSPNGTIVPDDVFDVLLPQLSDPELRILLYIIRKTFGWKKDSDNISLSQMVKGVTTKEGKVLDRGAGLSKSSAIRGIQGLTKKGVIKAVKNKSNLRGNEATTYELRFVGDPLSNSDTRGLSQSDTRLVSEQDTQQTDLQTTEINLSINRLRTHADFDVDNSISNVDKPHRNGSPGSIAKREDQEPKPATTFVGQDDHGSRLERPRLPGEAQSVGSVLKQGRGRPAKLTYDEDRVRIHAYIEDFARELGDNAKVKASVTRAYNIYKASGKDIDAFCQYMYQAKHKTQEYSSSIRTKREDGNVWAPKAKMAYWFKILETDLGLAREQPALPL